MKRRRRKIVQDDTEGDGLSPSERVCAILRDIQWQTNCSTLSLQSFLDSLHGKLGEAVRQCKISGTGLPRSVKSADRKMRLTVIVVPIVVFNCL